MHVKLVRLGGRNHEDEDADDATDWLVLATQK